MFGTIGCYNCYLTRSVLVPTPLGPVPTAPNARRKKRQMHAPPPQRQQQPPAASSAAFTQIDAGRSAQIQQAKINTRQARMRPSTPTSSRRFIPPPSTSTTADTQLLRQGGRVRVIGMGSQYVDQYGVVMRWSGSAGPGEIAVRLSNGRTEFFARRYLESMVTPSKSEVTESMMLVRELEKARLSQKALPATHQKPTNKSPVSPTTILQLLREENTGLPVGWIVLKPGHPRYDPVEGGKIYYHNTLTKSVQYDHPGVPASNKLQPPVSVASDPTGLH